VLLDEAYIHFQDVEEEDAGLRLVDAFPHLLVFRTFSKIFGLSGLRVGYAVGSPAAPALLNSLAPVLGVNVLAQAAVSQALKQGDRELGRRRANVIGERAKITDTLSELSIRFAWSQANFVWFSVPGMAAGELASGLEEKRVRVASGGPLGDDDHVRASIRDPHATERLLAALRQLLAERDGRLPSG
jgi:histidinol-phosphate aminotransferase